MNYTKSEWEIYKFDHASLLHTTYIIALYVHDLHDSQMERNK